MNAAAVAGIPESTFDIADLNQDGIVSGLDLAVMIGQWGDAPNVCPPYDVGDIDFDCEIGGGDLAILLGAWGETDLYGDSMPDDLAPGTWVRPFPPPTPVPMTVDVQGPTFSVISPTLGVLKAASTVPLWYGGGNVDVQTQLVPAGTGYSMVYTIKNLTGTSQALPKLWIRGHKMEDNIEYLFLEFGTKWQPLYAPPGTLGVTEQNRYPKTRYAPVAVARDSQKVIGISLEYPVLEYKHNVSPELRRYTDMFNDWGVYVALDANIEPGQTRTYTVNVRWGFDDDVDWVHTLKPYRDFLWDNYGHKAEYPQDLRPIYGRPQAFWVYVEPVVNPRGYQTLFGPTFSWRVDTDGWIHEVAQILQIVQATGHERVVMWQPSGLYSTSPDYPSQIMTHWTEPMLDTQDELLQLGEAGIDFGFWWGDSARVAHVWDPPVLESLDITNPAHIAECNLQASLCVARGAKTIALDSYRKLDLWNAVPWLEHLQELNPGVQYSAEPQCADILHIKIPFATENINFPDSAPLLADYLVPGRGVWTIFNFDVPLSECYRYIGWGTTVLTYLPSITAHDLAEGVEAAQSGWVLPWDEPTTLPNS